MTDKRPTRNYDYGRAGVAMLTMKANPGIRLCRITQETFTLLPMGEVAYVRDNVRRYRLLKANPELFRKAAKLMTLPDGTPLWGFGNRFLLKHPRRVRVQFSRRTPDAEWPAIEEQIADYLQQGYVFVSPFISPFEKRVLREVVERGGRAIRLTHMFFGERYKPVGRLFDLCSQGRLLELSVAGAFPRFARLDRAACLRLNEVTRDVATTQWSQRERG